MNYLTFVSLFNWKKSNKKKCVFDRLMTRPMHMHKEKASTHKNANTHASNVFVTRDLDL